MKESGVRQRHVREMRWQIEKYKEKMLLTTYSGLKQEKNNIFSCSKPYKASKMFKNSSLILWLNEQMLIYYSPL